MKPLLTILLSLLIYTTLSAQKTNPNYNAVLAKNLEAIEYGMKYYMFAILKTGQNAPNNKDLRQKSFEGHLKNIRRLADEEKLIVAGPFDP